MTKLERVRRQLLKHYRHIDRHCSETIATVRYMNKHNPNFQDKPIPPDDIVWAYLSRRHARKAIQALENYEPIPPEPFMEGDGDE
jgi:hypothetical protein